jgi:hypothetical protein
MCLGIAAIIFVVLEIINLHKAARMVPADFPNLTPEQLELKRSEMRQSAWWLLGGAIFLLVAGNALLLIAAAIRSDILMFAAYIVAIGGFLGSLVISAIHGTAAAKLK